MTMRILREPIIGGAGGGGGGGSPPAPALTADTAIDLKIFPEEIRGDASLAQVKTIGDLGKGYVNAQRLVGTDKIPAPQKGWTDQQWAEHYARLGRPEKPDAYKFPEAVKLVDGVKLDDAKLAKAREHFHKLGFTPQQAEGMFTYYANILNEAVTSETSQAEQSRISAEAKLRQELGGEEQYRAAAEMANSMLIKFGTPELVAFFTGNPALGNHPEMVKFLHKVSSLISDDKLRGAGGGTGPIVSDSTQAQREINRLSSDKEFQEALHDRSHVGHRDAVERWEHVFRVAFPGKVTA